MDLSARIRLCIHQEEKCEGRMVQFERFIEILSTGLDSALKVSLHLNVVSINQTVKDLCGSHFVVPARV